MSGAAGYLAILVNSGWLVMVRADAVVASLNGEVYRYRHDGSADGITRALQRAALGDRPDPREDPTGAW